jgi:hypothetical protein
MKLTIQHWPVLERRMTSSGKLGRTKRDYRRSKVPTQEREVDVVQFTSQSRVMIYFALADHMVFSVRTGRSIGRPEWILRQDSHKMLREHMKGMSDSFRAFEKELKWILFGAATPAPAPAEPDDDALAEALPANDVAT